MSIRIPHRLVSASKTSNVCIKGSEPVLGEIAAARTSDGMRAICSHDNQIVDASYCFYTRTRSARHPF